MPSPVDVVPSLRVGSQRGEVVATLRRISELVDLHRAELLEQHASRIETGLLGEWDPIRVPMDVFALMGRSWREVSWTQWLAAALRADAELSPPGLVWPALCSVVAAELDADDESNPGVATRDDWMQAAKVAPSPEHIRAEASILVGDGDDAAHGRPDILVHTPNMLVVLELKLGGTWNPGQPKHYRQLAEQERAPGQKIALLMMADTRAEGPPEFARFTWCDLGKALRRALRGRTIDSTSFASHFPALALLASIERHRLPFCLDARVLEQQSKPAHLDLLQQAAAYLET